MRGSEIRDSGYGGSGLETLQTKTSITSSTILKL